MARKAKVDLVNAQKDINIPKGINVTWHNKEDPKTATVTAFSTDATAEDILIDEFKTNAKSTTEIIPKFDFTPPVDIPIPPDPEAIKRQQAKDNWDALKAQEREDGIQAEYDKLP